MKKRFISSLYIAIVMFVAFISLLWTPYVFDVFIAVTGIVGCIEIARAFERKKQYTNIILIGTIVPMFFICVLLTILLKRSLIFLFLYINIVILILFLFGFLGNIIFKNNIKKEMKSREIEDNIVLYSFKKSINSMILALYPGFLFGLFFIVNHINEFAFTKSLNIPNSFVIFVLLLIFTITIFTDTFAYLIGSKLKGPKLCPLISPKKTISGAVAGLIFGSLGGILLYIFMFYVITEFHDFAILLNLQVWKILLISIIASIFSQLGDLFASFIKRQSRIKDYGTLFPGHGGVMDRVDGLVFCVVIISLSLIFMFIG